MQEPFPDPVFAPVHELAPVHDPCPVPDPAPVHDPAPVQDLGLRVDASIWMISRHMARTHRILVMVELFVG